MLLLSLVVIVVVLSCTCCSVVFERMANFRTPSQVVLVVIFVDVVVSCGCFVL